MNGRDGTGLWLEDTSGGAGGAAAAAAAVGREGSEFQFEHLVKNRVAAVGVSAGAAARARPVHVPSHHAPHVFFTRSTQKAFLTAAATEKHVRFVGWFGG